MLYNTFFGFTTFQPKWEMKTRSKSCNNDIDFFVAFFCVSLSFHNFPNFHFPIWWYLFLSPGLTLRTAGHRIIRSGSRRSTSEHENSINQQNKPHRFAANHSSVLFSDMHQLFSKWKKKWENFFFLEWKFNLSSVLLFLDSGF